MAATMNLLVIKHTGHVVAGVTRQNEGGDLDEVAMAGAALPVHSRREQGSVEPAITAWLPTSILEVASAPYNPRVLSAPQDYVIDGGSAMQLPNIPIAPVAATNTDQIDLTGVAGTEILTVVAPLDDSQEGRRVQAGSFPETDTSVSLPYHLLPDDTPASLPPGDIGIMVAAAGQRLHWEVGTLP